MAASNHETPFRTFVETRSDDAHPPDPPQPADEDGDWSADAIEEAYLRALETAEAAEQQLSEVVPSVQDGGEEPFDRASHAAGSSREGVETAEDETAAGGSPVVASAEALHSASAARQFSGGGIDRGAQVTPEQVLESLLFVGGEPLTGKRLADLLGGEFTHERIDELVADLGRRYRDDGRPYEVILGEGGYRLELRSEFEPVRNRVYGLGPREVKLSQDALEILALIAYEQPVSKARIEETSKANAATLVRQLLQRELISLQRDADESRDVSYRTTPRFLQLFGLAGLDDLPRSEDLMFK